MTHSGVELEDEGEFGTLHLGIGNGITFGSTIRAVGHVDLVVRHPIVEVDGKVVLKDRFLFERSRTLTILQKIRKEIIKNAICDDG